MDSEEQRQFDAMAETAAQDAQGDMDARIRKHVRADRRARRIRHTLRGIISVSAALLVLVMYGEWNPGGHGGTILCFGSFVILVAGGVLFCMGGLAPGYARHILSDKERQRLDD